MPLPKEVLDEINEGLEEAKQKMADVEDVISDLRASGIDASAQEARLRDLSETYNKMRMFYQRQIAKVKE